MNRYRKLLAVPEFRRLWMGSTASALGDGATWIALSWLVYQRTQSPGRVGLLVFAYGAPVLVGGLVTGPLLDRFGAVRVMRLDSLFRGAVMASIPMLASVGAVPLWALYAVATSYGLLKMVPLAGVPTLIPSLVRPGQLDTANAMESLSYGVSGVVAPMLAGVLIAAIGGINVLALDAISFFFFFFFAACLYGLGDDRRARIRERGAYGIREGVRFIRTSAPITLTTLMFASFNVGLGALLVVLPIYATTILDGGATLYAALTSSLLAGDLFGSFIVGAMGWRWPLGRSIAAAQTAVGVAFLPMLLQPQTAATLALLFLSGLLTSPLTIWAQTLRMRLIPPELRGRVFSLLRTTMQAAEPSAARSAAPSSPAADSFSPSRQLRQQSAHQALSASPTPPSHPPRTPTRNPHRQITSQQEEPMNSGDGAVLPTMETVTRSRSPWWLLHGAASPQYVCVSDLSGLEPFTRRG